MALDASTLLTNAYCLEAVSKDVDGKLVVLDVDKRSCQHPTCETLTLVQHLLLNILPSACDGHLLGPVLNGVMRVRNLTTVFVGLSENLRGVHAADFRWDFTGGGFVIGTLNGITNAGIIRPNVFPQCETCDKSDILTGHLFATGNNVPHIPVPD